MYLLSRALLLALPLHVVASPVLGHVRTEAVTMPGRSKLEARAIVTKTVCAGDSTLGAGACAVVTFRDDDTIEYYMVVTDGKADGHQVMGELFAYTGDGKKHSLHKEYNDRGYRTDKRYPKTKTERWDYKYDITGVRDYACVVSKLQIDECKNTFTVNPNA